LCPERLLVDKGDAVLNSEARQEAGDDELDCGGDEILTGFRGSSPPFTSSCPRLRGAAHGPQGGGDARIHDSPVWRTHIPIRRTYPLEFGDDQLIH
jgi:hypothetical protein